MTYIKLPLDWDEMTAELTTAEKGSLIDAIVTYAKGEKYELSGNERYVFMHYKKIIDREAEMRESSALSRRTNGQKGGRPKKTEYNRTKPNETENNRTKPKITESICKEKEGEKEKEKENEKESNKEKDKEKAKEREAEKEAHTSCVFIFPSAEDVRAYCKERNSRVNPEEFYNYYSANGWIMGNNPMRDWRAAVRAWENNRMKGGKKDVFAEHEPLKSFRHGCF